MSDNPKPLADGESYIDRVQGDYIVESFSKSAKLANGERAVVLSSLAQISPVLHERGSVLGDAVRNIVERVISHRHGARLCGFHHRVKGRLFDGQKRHGDVLGHRAAGQCLLRDIKGE